MAAIAYNQLFLVYQAQDNAEQAKIFSDKTTEMISKHSIPTKKNSNGRDCIIYSPWHLYDFEHVDSLIARPKVMIKRKQDNAQAEGNEQHTGATKDSKE